jgi:hypothetical protein
MRNGLFLLGGVLLLTSSLVAQAAQTTKPAQGDKPPASAAAANQDKKDVKVPEKVLKTYVGEYELRADWILTVTLENGSLWGQPTNQEKRQIFAESPTKFFLKDLPVTFEFQKDASGNVTGLHMVQEGRGERDLKKIK